VGGKFVFRGEDKVYLRGVTYGTFAGEDGADYPSAETVARDFAQMAASGVNAVRTYTIPPRWLLDLAQEHGLLLMVGIPWEQHVAFLEDRRRARSIEQRVREGVRACAGHPAILCYAVGNETCSSRSSTSFASTSTSRRRSSSRLTSHACRTSPVTGL